MTGKANQVLVRITDDLADILDGHVERMQKREPGVSFSRADALRSLAMKGNEVEERAEKRK